MEIDREAGSPEGLLLAVQNTLKADNYITICINAIPNKDDRLNGVIEAVSAIGGDGGVSGQIILHCISDAVEHGADLLSISNKDMLGLIVEDLGLGGDDEQ